MAKNYVSEFAAELRKWGAKPDGGEDFAGVDELARKATAILKGLREGREKSKTQKKSEK